MQSGTLELSGEALKRLEELKIGGIDVMTAAAMESLKMLRLDDEDVAVVDAGQVANDGELADLASTKLSLVESGEMSSSGSCSDSDSGYDLGGDGLLEEDLLDVTSTTASSLSSRSSVTGGSTESLLLAVQQQQEKQAAAATAAAAAAAAQQQQQLRFAVLSYEQVARLHDVMNETVLIHGRGNFPTLELRLRDLVTLVRSKLEADGVHVKDMRVNGGVASHVLLASSSSSSSSQTPASYNDLDLIFGVDLSSARTYDRIKTAVLDSLLDFLPAGVSRSRMLSCSLKEAYVSKMVKVTEGDRWSLISLGTNHRGKNVELKFVHTMRRQFEFSVDSFQIILDSLILFYDCCSSPPIINESFYPTVVAESVYGDFRQAHYHLHRRMIATRNPEEIRGGGLLKYCNLLVKDYRPADPDQIKTFERYMCSRFFIDFPDSGQQRQKLDNYLWNHFVGADEALKYDFLMILYSVVDESTVCLMGHERRQTLSLIEELAYQAYYADSHQQQAQQQSQQQQQHHHQQQQQQQQAAPVYEVRISGCQPTVVYSSSGGYFYAQQHHAPPPSSSAAPTGTTTATTPKASVAGPPTASAPCYPCSPPPPCACSCTWMACS